MMPHNSFRPLKNGHLEVRLAASLEEVEEAQNLRYRVFYQEMGAYSTAEIGMLERDFDKLDALCDHLVVIDHDRRGRVVGTYRLIRRVAAQQHGSFYSSSEFDISALENHPGEILELGRSCVEPPYRTRPTIQLLWSGIAEYMRVFHIELLFGCASFSGVDPDAYKHTLSYLYHNCLAPEPFRARALPHLYVPMDRVPADEICKRQAFHAIPPLVKGYIRLGGHIGDGAVIDHQFNTLDVCIILQTKLMANRYSSHYSRQQNRE